MATLGTLMVGVAHEVRNPLFSLTATIEALEQRVPASEEARAHLDTLKAQTQRIADVTSALLQYGKPAERELAPGRLEGVLGGGGTGVSRPGRAPGHRDLADVRRPAHPDPDGPLAPRGAVREPDRERRAPHRRWRTGGALGGRGHRRRRPGDPVLGQGHRQRVLRRRSGARVRAVLHEAAPTASGWGSRSASASPRTTTPRSPPTRCPATARCSRSRFRSGTRRLAGRVPPPGPVSPRLARLPAVAHPTFQSRTLTAALVCWWVGAMGCRAPSNRPAETLTIAVRADVTGFYPNPPTRTRDLHLRDQPGHLRQSGQIRRHAEDSPRIWRPDGRLPTSAPTSSRSARTPAFPTVAASSLETSPHRSRPLCAAAGPPGTISSRSRRFAPWTQSVSRSRPPART